MVDDEMLLAISNLFDIKLEPIKKDIADIRCELSYVKLKVVDVENGLSAQIKRTNLILENDMPPRLQNIEACYTEIIKDMLIKLIKLTQCKQILTLSKK